MKKVTLILAVVFTTFLLTSCTDESKKLEELNSEKTDESKKLEESNNEKFEVFAVDKTKIKRPGSQGS